MANAVLERYRALRAVSDELHSGCLQLVSQKTVRDTARAIGLLRGGTLAMEYPEEVVLVRDLCVHTARPGRSRAVDRFAQAAIFAAGSDAAMVLGAMQRARFSIWQVVGYHDDCGVIVQDTLRNCQTWLVDEALTAGCRIGEAYAARLQVAGDFVMSNGLVVPMTRALFAEFDDRITLPLQVMEPSALAGDYRFAQALYRAAVATNAMERVQFADTPLAA
ncbi:MAG: hypothetical protein WDN04_12185 [Rhodospirillales bacterium]